MTYLALSAVMMGLSLGVPEPAPSQPAPPGETQGYATTPAAAAEALRAAEEALAKKKPKLAAKLAAALPVDGPNGDMALTLRGWALIRSGAYAEAALMLDGHDHLLPELLYLRGLARLRGGETVLGRTDLAQLWWDDPMNVWATAALRELAEKPGYYYTSERRVIRRTIPRGYRGTKRSRAATIDLLDKLSRSAPRRGRLQAELQRAKGIRLMRAEKFAGAVHVLNGALALTSAKTPRRAITLTLGEAHRRRGYVGSATRCFDQVAGGYSDRLAHEAHALAGQMFIEHRDYSEARHRFEAQLIANPIGPERLSALRGLGWVAYRTGDFASARRFFKSLAAEDPWGEHAAGALYWAARSLEALSRDPEAPRAELVALAELFPVDYYTYRALARLGSRPWPAPTPALSPAPQGKRARRVQELLAAGMKSRVVHEALDILRGEYNAMGPTDLDSVEAAARQVGAGRVGASIAWRRKRRFPDGTRATIAPIQRQFPDTYVNLVRREARRQGVSQNLAIALARQESGLHPDAVSSAGAMGLMQLMPDTALEVARDFDPEANPSIDDVLVPTTNAKLGVRYLKKMLRTFSYRTELALAAYNAGPNAVTRWRKRGDLPVDIFVEEIPYHETRNYVRRVLAWRQAFRAMEKARRTPARPVEARTGSKKAGGQKS